MHLLLQRPFLHIDIDDDRSSRTKRMAHARLDCTNGKQSQYCCRYNLVADFDLIGWDFIIQPRHYMAFFCAGDCPYSFNPATGHSKVSYVAKDNPRKDDSWIQASKNAGPCCTGVRASSLDMIYFDENEHIRFGHLKNMIVNECACA
jgi:transforming growth factor beta-3